MATSISLTSAVRARCGRLSTRSVLNVFFSAFHYKALIFEETIYAQVVLEMWLAHHQDVCIYILERRLKIEEKCTKMATVNLPLAYFLL